MLLSLYTYYSFSFFNLTGRARHVPHDGHLDFKTSFLKGIRKWLMCGPSSFPESALFPQKGAASLILSNIVLHYRFSSSTQTAVYVCSGTVAEKWFRAIELGTLFLIYKEDKWGSRLWQLSDENDDDVSFPLFFMLLSSNPYMSLSCWDLLFAGYDPAYIPSEIAIFLLTLKRLMGVLCVPPQVPRFENWRQGRRHLLCLSFPDSVHEHCLGPLWPHVCASCCNTDALNFNELANSQWLHTSIMLYLTIQTIATPKRGK